MNSQVLEKSLMRTLFLGLIILSVVALGLPLAGTAWGEEPTVDVDVLWSTYVGGSGPQGEGVRDMALDSSGNIYIVGQTESTDMPKPKNAPGDAAWKAFVAKVDPAGTIQWTTYVSSDQNSEGFGVAVDRNSGDIYITGKADRGQVPLPGSGEPAAGAFVTKLDAEGNIQWTNRLTDAGAHVNWGKAITVDRDGYVFVTGQTDDEKLLPGIRERGAGADAFVAKLSPSGGLMWARPVGGAKGDEGNDIAVDHLGNIWVTGDIFWEYYGEGLGDYDMPRARNEWPPSCRAGFVAKLDPSGAIDWALYLGGHGDTGCNRLALDGSGGVYVAGWTNAADLNPPLTNECICDQGEGYFTRIDSEGNVMWTSYVAETWQAGAGDLIATGGDLLGMTTHRTTGFMLLDGATGAKKWYVNVQDMDLKADQTSIDVTGNFGFAGFELDLRGNVCLAGTMVDQELINLTNEYGGGRNDGFVMKFTFRGVSLLPPPLPPAEGTASQVDTAQDEEVRPTAAPVSEAPEVTQPVSAGEVGEVLAQPGAVVEAEPVGQPQIKDSNALPVESGQQEVIQPVEAPLPGTTQSGQDEKAGGQTLQPEAPVVAGAESPAQVVECCVSGREAFELGDYQTAAAVFEKCLAENYEYLGRAYYKLGDYPQAAEILKKASALNPQEATLYGYLGSTYFLLKDNEQATFYLNKAIELNPSLPEPYYYMGVIAYQQKEYEEAIRQFQTSLDLNVGGLKPYVYMQLGWANHRLERYQEAKQAFLESVALDPTNANSYGGLGAVYYRLGDCSRSISMYEKAIELAPNFQGWKDGLARCQK